MRRERLKLNFAPAHRKWSLSTTVILAFSLAVLGVASYGFGNAWMLRAAAEQQFAMAQADAAGPRSPPSKPIDAKGQAREMMARRVLRDLNAPWPDLLNALDAATSASVALLVAAPTSTNRTVRLTAEARDVKAMLAYLATLQLDGRLSQVVLLSHQFQADDAAAAVRFQIQASWGQQP